jgi:hypothetical protein
MESTIAAVKKTAKQMSEAAVAIPHESPATLGTSRAVKAMSTRAIARTAS